MKIKLFIVLVFSISNIQCVSNNRSVEGNLNQIIEEVLIDSSFVSLREDCGIDSTNTFYIYNSIIFGYFDFYGSYKTKFEEIFGHKLNYHLSFKENQRKLYIEDSLRIEDFKEIDIDEKKITRFSESYELFLIFDIIDNKYFFIEVYCNNKPNKAISYFFVVDNTSMILIQKKILERNIFIE